MNTINYSLNNIELTRDDVISLVLSGNLQAISRDLNNGHLLIIRAYLDVETVQSLRQLSLDLADKWVDEFMPFDIGIPNNTRVHSPRPENIVPAYFKARNFYPWNISSLGLFNKCMDLYRLRAGLVGKSAASFISEYDNGYAARLALQFYPENKGYFKSHRDPYEAHQVAIPTIALSKSGMDFSSGGFYLIGPQNLKVYIDPILEPGDAILFHSLIEHGVDLPTSMHYSKSFLDEGRSLSSRIPGRLMLLCAVNKLVNSQNSFKHD